ncbi:UNVERIFIED_ORG: hypothetical protein FNL38_11155 [Nocardia globerula]|uniref:Uncharacterized protein n=1 Tax=Nocardia globerula TaxID=1818 RepID=A0A652YHX4_NOCGL|nr:hypothetical protein [Nocardia globerula]
MDGNSFAAAVIIAFNALSLAGVVICARRSYRRHRRVPRAFGAAIAGAFIVPLLLVFCVALAQPRGAIRTH